MARHCHHSNSSVTKFPPILLLQAGKDRFCKNSPMERLVKAIRKGGGLTRSVFFPKAYHELLIESDNIRGRCLREIEGWFLDHSMDVDMSHYKSVTAVVNGEDYPNCRMTFRMQLEAIMPSLAFTAVGMTGVVGLAAFILTKYGSDRQR